MPRILNARALQEAPEPEPLDVRLSMEQFASAAFGLSNGSVGLGEASGGVSGTLRLVNYWNNPFGIRGIGVGKAVINIGGQAAAGAALNNAGVGVDVFGGLGGEMACLTDEGDIIGKPQAMSGFMGFKIGVPPIPTGFGIEASGGALTFVDALRCRAKVFISIALGMGDTLSVALPEGPARDLVAAIQDLADGSVLELEQVLLAPLAFEPIRVFFDGVRFGGDFYLATPGVNLPGRLETVGLKSAGKIEIKPDVDGDWVEVADAAINATFADGLSASFGLADYNLGNLDLIVMDNVQGSFEMPIPAVHTATLDFTGHQVFLGLDSNTRVSMSLTEGILIDSTTVIDGLGEMAIDAHTKGTIEHWPPLGGAGGLDLETQAHFTLDLDHAAEQIHGAVNGVLSGANEAYRSALNVLNNQGHEERELHNRIGALEAEIRQRSDVINSQLRPGFDRAEDGLAQAQRHMSNVWGDIHYFERRKDDAASRCDGWPWNWEHCAEASYWLGRELASRGLVWAAGIALDVGYSVLNTSERVLNDALYEVNRVLDPRLNAYRIALVGIRAGKAVAAITVRAL